MGTSEVGLTGGDRDGAFAISLRAAIANQGLSLRRLQGMLQEGGHVVSVATLSSWQAGLRIPSSPESLSLIGELEGLLGLNEGDLQNRLAPHRRVPADRNVPFAEFIGLEQNELTDEGDARELSERSSTLLTYVDDRGLLIRNLVRNVWQARVEGAQRAVVFTTIEPEETTAPQVRGLVGCDLVDVTVHLDQRYIRSTLRLHAPMSKGNLFLTEWETKEHEYEYGAISNTQGIVAVRPEAEVGVFIFFDPDFLPRRCWASVTQSGIERHLRTQLTGNCASHVEFGFGPGSITLNWEW